jgi:hypothetical protein
VVSGSLPVQPTLSCWETLGAFNTSTCAWNTIGSQPIAPSGLACYQSAAFNITTCSWVVSGTQAAQPTGLSCWQTTTFNTVSCAWVTSGTQAVQPTLGCNETAAFNTTTCAWLVTTGAPCNSTLNITMFIEGYYVGANTMTPVKANQGIGTSTTIVDDILVELRHPTTFALVASTQGVLQTNGTAACTFSTAQSGSFYIVVKHRNAVQTWSANPVVIGATSSYNFSASANKAYGDNMKEVESGVWAFYTGDVDQNGNIDIPDYSQWEADYNEFASGVFATDLDGNGNVDISDYTIWENNYNNFVSTVSP